MTPNNFAGLHAGSWQDISSISVSASHFNAQCRHRIFLPLPQVTLQDDQSVHLPHLSE